MTLRHVVCLAMIASALLTLDICIAGAQVHNCKVYLKDCHYGSDGRLRWERWAVRPVSLTSEGSHSSGGDHRWGCGATDGTAKGRSWGYGNRTAASYRALAECSRKTAGSCHIMSCSASVSSRADVPSAWF
jgi:hypothetical protein